MVVQLQVDLVIKSKLAADSSQGPAGPLIRSLFIPEEGIRVVLITATGTKTCCILCFEV